MSSRLIAHCGAQRIDRATLATLPTPARTATWTPVPHSVLVAQVADGLQARGVAITKEQYAVQGAKLFGLIDTDYGMGEDGGAAIGLRAGNDRRLSIQMAIGYRVFVCDNMSFAGDLIALRKKHTGHLQVEEAVAEGLDRYMVQYRQLADKIDAWKATTLAPEKAKAMIYDIFARKIMPHRLFAPVTEEVRMTLDKGTCTAWSVQNACTLHLQKLKTASFFQQTVQLGKFFDRVGV